MKKKSIVRTHIEVKIIFIAVAVLFVWFLAVPIVTLLLKSFQSDTGALWVHYADVFSGRGYAIYPGKVTDADTFRIGNIGEIYEEDILKLCGIIEEFFAGQDQRKAG